MKILEFSLCEDLVKRNQAILSDMIRAAVYNENRSFFELLDYDDDYTFLEPTAFSHFLLKSQKKISLCQSLIGYGNYQANDILFEAASDQFGRINIPNKGYLSTHDTNLNKIKLSSADFIPVEWAQGTTIRLCSHLTDLLDKLDGLIFFESPEETLRDNKAALTEAIFFIKKELSIFWEAIQKVTREIVLFNSPNYNSFAGISHHGTAYLNTENKSQTSVFFVDDIAHQCGHILFNALTMESSDYLKVSKDHPLRYFTGKNYDTRDVYGAFHGLFTYTTILFALDGLLKSSQHPLNKIEAIGRLGFYISKFSLDTESLNNNKVLTEVGMHFHTLFVQSYQYIREKYAHLIDPLSYQHQSYNYNHDVFLSENKSKLKHVQ